MMDHAILVVEDDKGIREAIQIYLKNQGYRVFLAENGQEGLDIVNKETIHLAIDMRIIRYIRKERS